MFLTTRAGTSTASEPRASEREGPTVRELAKVAMFAGLDEELLEWLASMLHISTLASGERVFSEGDQGRDLYVVLAGNLEALKRSKRGHDVRLSVIGEGEWFGEMSLIDVMARPATVRALEPARLLCVRPTDLDSLYRKNLRGYALLVMNIARQLSRKLRVAEGILAETVIDHYDPDPAAEPLIDEDRT